MPILDHYNMRPAATVKEFLHAFAEPVARLAEGKGIDSTAARWADLEARLAADIRRGDMSTEVIEAASAASHNVSTILRVVMQLQQESEKSVADFRADLACLFSRDKAGPYGPLGPPPGYSIGSQDHPPLSSNSQKNVVPAEPVTTVPSRIFMGRDCPLRQWFLTHLPYPYPTYTEKRNLALQAGIPLSKIDSDLTNWRRRSGWAEIRKIFAKGSKDKMKSLLLRVERGEDTRPDLLDRIEGIRQYMDKESDKVSDWVHEVSPS